MKLIANLVTMFLVGIGAIAMAQSNAETPEVSDLIEEAIANEANDHFGGGHHPPKPTAEYRWSFIEGTNHWTGVCGNYHNIGDPNGQRCYSPGDIIDWQYAWAKGGCSPNYAVWVNSYICKRVY